MHELSLIHKQTEFYLGLSLLHVLPKNIIPLVLLYSLLKLPALLLGSVKS